MTLSLSVCLRLFGLAPTETIGHDETSEDLRLAFCFCPIPHAHFRLTNLAEWV